MSLGQIATATELPRSTVQRIVGALALEGLVSTGSGPAGITLGPEIHTLASGLSPDPRIRLKPIMSQIAADTGETVDLAVLQDGRMRFVDQIVGRQRLRAVSSIGDSFPLTTTANGKAALACLDEIEATRVVLAELAATRDPSVNLAEFLAEIEGIRNGALARDDGEHTDGISALGFGIAQPDGQVFAISVPVPSSRFARVEAELVSVLGAMRARFA